MDLLDNLDPALWWLVIGLAFAALELVVPGVYLIWLAAAALTTSALTFVLDLGIAVQVVNFVFLSLIIVYSAKRWLRDRPIESSDPMMNRRGDRLVGEQAVITVAIDGGEGRARLGDSEWIARGADQPVGTRVLIAAVKGPILEVVPLKSPEEAGDTLPPATAD
ncbi:NfeD family protein [Erythrobacter sp. HKB08]|uniref:NfeD family protein n=1 Tax=Erythrobacter sp. HKB08 TaxID=2502843 RepID=UPI0013E8B36F|nr:NfeD family protein [Erythrobacter sp. HKB08]